MLEPLCAAIVETIGTLRRSSDISTMRQHLGTFESPVLLLKFFVKYIIIANRVIGALLDALGDAAQPLELWVASCLLDYMLPPHDIHSCHQTENNKYRESCQNA